MKVVYIGAALFVEMYQFWILSSCPQLAYNYWVVFSLGIQVDRQSKQVICELFCKRQS